MRTPVPHRKHHLCCAAAHLFLATIAVLERAYAVAAAEIVVALANFDMWRREDE